MILEPYKIEYLFVLLLLYNDFHFCRCVEFNIPSIFGITVNKLRDYFPENVVNMVETVGDIVISSADKKCIYRCPDGSKPRRNIFYEPVSNGCGAGHFRIDRRYVPIKEITSCCDKHDVCYGTCNKEMSKCDKEFEDCLYDICLALKKLFGTEVYNACKSAVSTIYKTTSNIGCKYYKDAQKHACICDTYPRGASDEF